MKKTAYIILVVSLAALLFWALAPRQKLASADAKDFDAFVTALIDEQAIPGIAIAVVRARQVVHLQGYGYADVEARRPMTADTPMNIASISKPILGIVLLQLRDKGLLDLDADINRLLPFRVNNPNAGGAPITVRQLATHTSGIEDYYEIADYQKGAASPTKLSDYLRSLVSADGTRYEAGAHFLDAKPGTAREYSNLGAGVAGAVAEAVGGASLAALAKNNVFEPLGMANASWLLADYPVGKLATRYEVAQCLPYTSLCASTQQPKRNYLVNKIFRPTSADRRLEVYPQFGNPNYPDGGVNASARDLTLLAQSILAHAKYGRGKLLSQASFEEMLKLQLPAEIDDRQRFFWRDRNGLTGHSGSDLGVYTSLYFDKQRGDAIIVLMNRTPDLETEDAMARLHKRAQADFLGR
ncbi:serine hydrolase [Polymorphobacter multimanifer]|uniref:CubicO group peptidase (Beta-lactamase class C family) n=1 Tax=Polymorphobacter multimanifer TaxID=1070431 RepID=A0A841L9Y7_9SPHN|nr:serine hydrolase domain-containing protein [Polymorphobacter multimanifer]MBB6228956.1 CubicO group peptidase (beta-lactamase class C family) [Polymorphobacter multimanifer]GGI73792.1 serine hydrolase [Polymorphobacter multimanifer]